MQPTRTYLPRNARFRAWGLLDMLYTPAELAEELQVDRDVIYHQLIPAGLPHQRDTIGHIWIHGPTAATWILNQRRRKSRMLEKNEFLCLHCRSVVISDPSTFAPASSGRFHYVKAVCPTCGTTLCKGAKKSDNQ